MVRIAGAVLLALVVIQFVAVEAASGPCHKLTALDAKGKKKNFNLDALTSTPTYSVSDSQYTYEFKICGNFQCTGVQSPTGACQEGAPAGNNPLGAYPNPVVATWTTVGYPKGALVLPLGVQDNQGSQRTATITIVCDSKASYVLSPFCPAPPTYGSFFLMSTRDSAVCTFWSRLSALYTQVQAHRDLFAIIN